MLTRTSLAALLATTAMTCLATAAVAQTAPAASSAKAAAANSETVTVTGRSTRTTSPGAGLMRVETAPKAVQTITRDFIAKQSPTTNMQQLLRMLPSTNVTDVDPYGLYSGTSRVRGLDTSEQGYLLDGAPLNDVGGGQFYSNEVLEAEDLETVSLQPGTTNLDSPVISAAGGLVEATMKDPAKRAGGLLDVTYGTYKLNREFIRLDTGLIGNSGIRAMFAFSHTHANNWEGPGGAEKKHYDFKVVKDWSNGSHAGLTVSYNDQVNDSYNNGGVTQANYFNLIEKGNSNSYGATWLGPKSIGSGASAYNPTNFYLLHQNPFENVIAVAPVHIVVTPRLSIDDTPYFWHGIGNGTGATTLTEGSTYYGSQKVNLDLNGDGRINSKTSVIAFSPSNQEQFRPGNTIKANIEIDKHNTVTAGWWYEYSNLLQFSPIGHVDQQTGIPNNVWGVQDNYILPNGKQYYARDYTTITQINMVFLGDHASYFDDRLHVDAGFKETMVSRALTNRIPGTAYSRNVNDALPLPQLGISWQFDPRNQIYVSGATNFRAPSNTSLADQYSNTSGKISQQGGSIKSEYSISEEVGYRYTGPLIVGSISFFNYNFTNRQISLNYFVGNTPYSSTVNAGGQTTRGVDIQLSTRPILFHIRPYAAFEYLDATIDNNLAATGTLNGKTINDYLPTAGKQAIASPHVQAKFGLDYDDGTVFLGADLDYVGKQYSTFMNDESMPWYITNSVYGGYRFHSFGRFKSPQIQINTGNLTGATYRTGVYTVQNNAQTTKGVFGSTIAGSAPAYYLQPGFYIAATLSTAF
ncbi:TonB-dependent receptor [Acetobacteraceae bacterium KSS8]|uniref:TonB-dependent receptor n=1 Tax=Endosaccharibacter trunci TaxID=2812733 RepID=A0ABT1W365_9PROT|nr:TonB-dependent receptor [Acetobacteraceae bacterium KSS8]